MAPYECAFGLKERPNRKFPPRPCVSGILGKNAAAASPSRACSLVESAAERTIAVSASPASSPQLDARAFDFGDLGRPRPPSVRSLPLPSAAAARSIAQADASGQLDEIDADDILEENDIDALDAAAADFHAFTPASSSDVQAPVTQASSPPSPAPAPAPAPPVSDPTAFEVSDLGAFDDVEVEGEPAPVSIKVDYAAPSPSTLVGFPAAPITSPLPLDSVYVDDAQSDGHPERTLEIPAYSVQRAAAVAAELDASNDADATGKLDAQAPQQTEVLHRSAMPAALQAPRIQRITPMLAPVRPSSIAPVAMDASVPAAHMIRPAVKSPTSSLAIGGVVFALVAIIGFLGVGAYVATRAIADKADAVAVAPSPQAPATEATPAAPPAVQASPGAGARAPALVPGAPAELAASAEQAAPAPAAIVAAAPPTDIAPANPAALDVSSLPSAPAQGARAATAPKAITADKPEKADKPATTTATRGATSGTALPPPGALPASGSAPAARPAPATAGQPLAAPVAAAPAAAPAPAGPAATTGVIRVDPKLRAVVVDGSYRRVDGGQVTVSCGAHRVKAGMNDVQSVNVPCGGSTSL